MKRGLGLRAMFLVVCLLFLPLGTNSWGKDVDFGTALALINAPLGADSFGPWAATPDLSSGNPAIIAITQDDFRLGFYPNYSRTIFSDGPRINSYSVAIAGKMPRGVVQLYASTSEPATAKMTETETNKLLNFEIDKQQMLGAQYGFKVGSGLLRKGDSLYLGAGFSNARNETSLDFVVPTPATAFLIQEKTKSESNMLSFGLVYSPLDRFHLGGTYAYSWDETRSRSELNGNQWFHSEKGNTTQVRIGVGLELLEGTFLAADYQHLNLGNAYFDKWFAGIKQTIIKDRFHIYGGWAADGPVIGTEINFNKRCGLNMSYANNAARELEPYFGRAEVWSAMFYLEF